MATEEKDTPSTTKATNKKKKKGSLSDKKRLNLELTSAAYETLQDIADESGKTLADVLRTGLALYGIAQDEKKKGRGIGVIEGEKVVKEILLT